MPEKLKDRFFTTESVTALADILARRFPRFNTRRFLDLVLTKSFAGLELKARMRYLTECLRPVLPKSYGRAVQILKQAAPEVKGFEAMCLPDFVECYGLEDWETSLPALAHFTRFSSSEFAIRPFIVADPERAMAFMERLADHREANVRRFASEGCRPRLPWAMALPAFKQDPALILPILEKLRDDSSEFVRKSVANNLNDISKDHPDLLLDLADSWLGHSERTDWIVKHACRTLLKAGNQRAMLLFGFGDPVKIEVMRLKLDRKRLAIGGSAEFTFTIKVGTRRACDIRLEYAVYYPKATGKIARKVFKISEKSYEPGQYVVSRRHGFADLSTRKHQPGRHRIVVVVNGVEKTEVALTLTDTT